jgi:hypothetical protein
MLHYELLNWKYYIKIISENAMASCNVVKCLIFFQQDATYSIYYISVGSSTCFGCWHPSSGAGTAVLTASGIGWLQWVKYAAINTNV